MTEPSLRSRARTLVWRKRLAAGGLQGIVKPTELQRQ